MDLLVGAVVPPGGSNAHDLWIGLGLGREGRTFPSDRLLVIE